MMAISEELKEIAAACPVDLSPDMLAQQTIERLDAIVTARTETHVPRVASLIGRLGSSTLITNTPTM